MLKRHKLVASFVAMVLTFSLIYFAVTDDECSWWKNCELARRGEGKDGRHLGFGKRPLVSHDSHYHMTEVPVPPDHPPEPHYSNFSEALCAKAGLDRTIVLASLDSGYLEFGINLYETSFKKFAINNYLFVCSDDSCVKKLQNLNISVVAGVHDTDASNASNYGTESFRRKTHLKTMMVLKALELGYSVLLVDVDIVFLKNPFPYFTCSQCDMEIQTDGHEINSGFYFVRPTKASITLHKKALKLGMQSQVLTNQGSLAKALAVLEMQGDIKVQVLNPELFPPGNKYFEDGQRMFYMDNPCYDCVIVHNNWLVSAAAKKYRFKEMHLWYVDRDNYYTDRRRNYLYYENILDFGPEETIQQEIAALQTALTLGYLLNRTVILPAFHCYGCHLGACTTKARHCSMNTHIHIETFDRYFDGAYREHVFLMNPSVPSSIYLSLSEVISIQDPTTKMDERTSEFLQVDQQRIFTPAQSGGASVEEILRWFKPYENTAVLLFHSLYGVFQGLPEWTGFRDIQMRITKGIKRSNYRQYSD